MTPRNQTTVHLNTVAGASLQADAEYGAGTVIVAQFGASLTDKANVEKRLRVTTCPKVTESGTGYAISGAKAAPSTETESG